MVDETSSKTGASTVNTTTGILAAIGSTDRVYADNFLKNPGDTVLMTDLLALIDTLEEQGLMTTVRCGHGHLISLNLTELGAERAREVQETHSK